MSLPEETRNLHPLRRIASMLRKGPWEITLQRIGSQDVMIIDHFYEDVEQVRELALSLDFIDTDKTVKYPGRRASISLDQSALLQEVLDAYTERRGQKRLLVQFYFTGPMVFSQLSKTRSMRPDQVVPHVDVGSAYSAIIYLNPPEQCRGGTSFYRHRETGIDFLPFAPDAGLLALMRERGYTPGASGAFVKFVQEVFLSKVPRMDELQGYSGLRTGNAHWELTGHVEMRCNRLVLAPGRQFHSAMVHDDDFGDTPRTMRLTQNVFFTP